MRPPYRLLDLFSGIGGFSLGLERSGGFKTVAFCEIEPFCRRVLKKHWPEVPCYDDVRTLTADRLAADGIGVDAICGGFPCQDISVAGKGAGIEGERSGLWSEYARIVSEVRPRYVIVENVAALLSNGMGRVLGDLAERGYDAEWRNIPAWFVGLPHQRERIWIVAYAKQERWARVLPNFVSKFEAESVGRSKAAIALAASRDLDKRARGHVCGESPFLNGAYGVSEVVGGLGAAGNAVVPQIPELLGRAILAAEGVS